jgi:uncharacterized protein YkwD
MRGSDRPIERESRSPCFPRLSAAAAEKAGGMSVGNTTAVGRTAVLALAAAMLVALGAAVADPARADAAQCRGADQAPTKLRTKQASKAMLCLINKERKGRGLRALHRQSEQTKAATRHTKRMIRSRCFSHQCPGEKDLAKRLTQVNYLPCTCSWGIGENIAYGERGLGSPRRIFEAWMNSPDHRANMLGRSYQHIGIGVGWGTPTGGPGRASATYTADFGYRR